MHTTAFETHMPSRRENTFINRGMCATGIMGFIGGAIIATHNESNLLATALWLIGGAAVGMVAGAGFGKCAASAYSHCITPDPDANRRITVMFSTPTQIQLSEELLQQPPSPASTASTAMTDDLEAAAPSRTAAR